MEVSKKELRLLLPELKGEKFTTYYYKRDRILYIDIYKKTEEKYIYDKKTIKYEGELKSIMRELKLKQLGI